MDETKPKQLIHPRISSATYNALIAFADRTHRTLSGAVDHILSEYLANEAEVVAVAR